MAVITTAQRGSDVNQKLRANPSKKADEWE